MSLEQSSVVLKCMRYGGRGDRWAMEVWVKTEAEFILENCSVRQTPWQNGSWILVPAHMELESPDHGNSPASHTTHPDCHQYGALSLCSIYSMFNVATSILECHLPRETGHGQHDTTDLRLAAYPSVWRLTPQTDPTSGFLDFVWTRFSSDRACLISHPGSCPAPPRTTPNRR